MKTREERRAWVLRWQRKDGQHLLDFDDEFPSIEMFGPQSIGAEVGRGWAALLRPCLEVLSQHGCKVGQIKQKFCELRVYWDAPDGLSDGDRSKIESVIANASAVSLRTCEDCGEQAERDAGRLASGTRLCDLCRSAEHQRLTKTE